MRQRRFVVRGASALVVVLLLGVSPAARAADPLPPPATPRARCAPGDLPEQTQGRVPAKDYEADGKGHVRAADGYFCNARQVATAAATGGYRVYRYVDRAGHVCGYYDTTLLFPGNLSNSAQFPVDTGVWVLDMADPAHPVHTDTLRTPAMQTPHESLSLNQKRGLLGAVMSNPAFYPGQFDLYDLTADCRHPALASTLPVGVLGHEGSFAPDGNTYYAASLYGQTLTAIDVSSAATPRTLFNTTSYTVHGLNVSDDGNTLYFANNGTQVEGAKGLTILDVSSIQRRDPVPAVKLVSHTTWATVSTPQTALPITVAGHPYLVEVDEFGTAPKVGAARIIDIGNPAHPRVVSDMRLAVNNTVDYDSDPGASSSLQGYDAHYCSVPTRVDPSIVACSFIASGLRVFDIHDVRHPVEVAYFNKPDWQPSSIDGSIGGAYAMSAPAYDVARHQVWYSDGNAGLFVVHITAPVPFVKGDRPLA